MFIYDLYIYIYISQDVHWFIHINTGFTTYKADSVSCQSKGCFPFILKHRTIITFCFPKYLAKSLFSSSYLKTRSG